MSRNENKQSRICEPHIFATHVSFSYLREYVLLLKYGKNEDVNNFGIKGTAIASLSAKPFSDIRYVFMLM